MKEGRKGTEKLPTPDSHVDGEKGTKTIVYNTKMAPKKRGTKKEKERNERKVEER